MVEVLLCDLENLLDCSLESFNIKHIYEFNQGSKWGSKCWIYGFSAPCMFEVLLCAIPSRVNTSLSEGPRRHLMLWLRSGDNSIK